MTTGHAFTALDGLRILCGFFFIPHVIGKVTDQKAAFGFFHVAGFRPAALFGYLGMAIEIAVAACLLSDHLVRPAAWIGSLYLIIATAAVVKVEKKWLWHLGGCEYPLFWGLCCGLVGFFA